MDIKNYRPDIDGLRAVAVIGVILYHVGFNEISGGFVGVDVFFVISGYLITQLIKKEVDLTNAFYFPHFYIRRTRRLFPALLFTLLITFIFAFLLFTPEHLKRLGGSIVYAVMSLSNVFFWTESGYFDTSVDYKPLLHTWSLSVEEQFYLLWPITLVFVLIKFPKLFAPVLIIIVCLFSLFLNIVFQDGESQLLTSYSPSIAKWFEDGSATIYFLLPFRVFELGIGAALVWIIQFQPRNKLILEPLLVLGLLLIIYASLAFDENTVFPSYNALIPCLGAALVIYAGTANYSGRVLNNKLCVGIGLISYSLYLIHWPIIVFYKYYKFDELENIERWGIIVASIVVAILMYRYVEKPFRYKSESHKSWSRSAFGLMCAILALLVTLPAATLWASNGWNWRIPELPIEISNKLKNSKQFHKDQYGGEGYPHLGWVSGNSNADLIIIGDSHARQYIEGLYKELGLPFNKNIYIASASCLMLPDMTRTTPGKNWDKICPGRLDAALRVLDVSPNAVVMLSASWGFQLERAATLNPKVNLSVDVSNPDSFGIVFKKIDKLKRLIGDKKLILVGHAPSSGKNDVIKCYARPDYIKSNCKSHFGLKEKDGVFFQGNKLLHKYTLENDGIYFIDPYEAFCFDGFCRSVKDDVIFYSDSFHLSKQGSIYFSKYYKNTLLSLMSDN